MKQREPIVAFGKRKFTIEEYLELEERSTEKHEYYQGEIFAMSGAKKPHNDIIMNLMRGMILHLEGKPCKPYDSNQRIFIQEEEVFTYPDISIFCDEVAFRNDDQLNALNPTVLVEVLSPSTRYYDQGTKFKYYRSIPSLQEYLMVNSMAMGVAIFRRNDKDEWVLEEYSRRRQKLFIYSIGLHISLEDIYAGTNLAEWGMIVREPEVEYGKRYYTIDEYLVLDRAARNKSDYFLGEVIPRPAWTWVEYMLFSNLFGNLSHLSLDRPCRPVAFDQRIFVPEESFLTYPDISVFYGPLNSKEFNEDSLMRPVALIEIMTTDSGSYDRGEKFRLYRSIPTLLEYIVVDSTTVCVEAYRKNEDYNWVLKEYTKPDQALEVHCLKASLTLQEIYANTKLLGS